METATQQPSVTVVKSGGGIGTSGVVLAALVIGGAAYAGKKMYDASQKAKGEADLDTPAGAIALQLKTVFDSFPVDQQAYKRVALQITPDLKDEVYKIYKRIALRNLSEDISTKIEAGTQNTTAKQEKINSTVNSVLKISPDDKIQFLISKNSLVRFEPGSKTPIPLYLNPLGIVTGAKPTYLLQPSAYNFKVWDTREVVFEGVKAAEGWQKYIRPYVRSRKVFAAVQIVLPMVDKTTGKKSYVTLWGDARSFRIGKGTNFLRGLGCGCNKTIDCKTNLGLVA
jgi:hypothetical protein